LHPFHPLPTKSALVKAFTDLVEWISDLVERIQSSTKPAGEHKSSKTQTKFTHQRYHPKMRLSSLKPSFGVSLEINQNGVCDDLGFAQIVFPLLASKVLDSASTVDAFWKQKSGFFTRCLQEPLVIFCRDSWACKPTQCMDNLVEKALALAPIQVNMKNLHANHLNPLKRCQTGLFLPFHEALLRILFLEPAVESRGIRWRSFKSTESHRHRCIAHEISFFLQHLGCKNSGIISSIRDSLVVMQQRKKQNVCSVDEVIRSPLMAVLVLFSASMDYLASIWMK